MTQPLSSFSLFELNQQVKDTISQTYPRQIWVRAEISELHENQTGHAYFELIEKEVTSDQIIAKNKASCWASIYRMLKPYFESTTGEKLTSGIKILVACTIEYHELYGFSLNIKDIDPTYTLGDLAQRRKEIIHQLKEDGVFEMNRELVMDELPQRIAVISSPSAAGYGDFEDQLKSNSPYAFYIKLFPAIMQGEKAIESIVTALDKINEHINKFDVVVIVRGGWGNS